MDRSAGVLDEQRGTGRKTVRDCKQDEKHHLDRVRRLQLEAKPDVEAFLKSKYIALYDGIKQEPLQIF